MRTRREVIGALDLESSSVVMIIAESTPEGVNVLGTGVAPCDGLTNGRIVSINDTSAAISRARAEAEQMSGCQLSEVYVSFTGNDIEGINVSGSVYHKRCKQVSRGDVESSLEKAIQMRMKERRALNLIPRQYILDRNDRIRDPIGMSGVQLEADVHVTTADSAVLDTISRCVEKASLKVRDFVVGPFASSLAVLRDEERKMGAIMINMGAGTTGIQVWSKGRLEWTGVFDVGTDSITSAISRSLRTPMSVAEDIRTRWGAAAMAEGEVNEMIPVPSIGGRGPSQLSRQVLIENIIQPTLFECFSEIANSLSSGFDFSELTAGIILTGDAAVIPEIAAVSSAVFNLNTRLGAPEGVAGFNSRVEEKPRMSAAWGTVIFRAMQPVGFDVPPILPRSVRDMPGSGIRGLFNKAMLFVF